MDFPCRIHRCRRRCWRLCHGTYNTTPATSTPFPYPPSLHGSDNYLHSPNLSPSRCLMFLGHDRWQVSVGVASCKFFFWVLERASDMFWNVKVTSSSTPDPRPSHSRHTPYVCALECQKFWLILALRFADLFDDAFFASPALTRSQLEGETQTDRSHCAVLRCATLWLLSRSPTHWQYR